MERGATAPAVWEVPIPQWRSLKRRWLFLHPLDNVVTVKKLDEIYVTEHNERIPHAAFEGQTPEGIYFGRGAQIPGELAALRAASNRSPHARTRRPRRRAGRRRTGERSPTAWLEAGREPPRGRGASRLQLWRSPSADRSRRPKPPTTLAATSPRLPSRSQGPW